MICSHCEEREASCIGRYDMAPHSTPACDACCGHGNEDGACEPITEEQKDRQALVDQAKHWHEAAIAEGRAKLRAEKLVRELRLVLSQASRELVAVAEELARVRKERGDVLDRLHVLTDRAKRRKLRYRDLRLRAKLDAVPADQASKHPDRYAQAMRDAGVEPAPDLALVVRRGPKPKGAEA